MFNLKESDEVEAQERYRDDEELCRGLLVRELKVGELKVEKLIRIGIKRDNYTRPLLIKLGCEEEKKIVLYSAKKLRQSERFERVYINRDLTEKERVKERMLREELKEKRNRNTGMFKIRRGKIVSIEEENRREINENRGAKPKENFGGQRRNGGERGRVGN